MMASSSRSWLWHLAFGAMLAWLAWHAFSGKRGVLAWLQLRQQVATQQQNLERLERDNARLSEAIGMLKDPIDPDFLEARVRSVLGYVHPSERVIVLD